MGLSDVAAFKAAKTIIPADYAGATTDGVEVDTMGYHQALIVVNAGVITTTLDVHIEAATTSGGSFVDVTGAAFNQILAAGDEKVVVGRINLDGTNRYIRAVGVSVGAANLYGVSILLTPMYTGDGSTFDFEV